MRMCGYGASRHIMGGGLSPSGKVDSLSSRNQGVVFAPYFSRLKMTGIPKPLGSGSMADTPAMVSQVRCTGVRFGAGCKVGVPCACDGALVMSGSGAGGNVLAPCRLVLVVTAWRAYVGARLRGAACLVLCWGSRRSLSTWTGRQSADAIQYLVELTRLCS